MREWTVRQDEYCNSLTTVTKDNYILIINEGVNYDAE